MSERASYVEGGAVIRPAGWAPRDDWGFDQGAEGFQFQAPIGGEAPLGPPIEIGSDVPMPVNPAADPQLQAQSAEAQPPDTTMKQYIYSTSYPRDYLFLESGRGNVRGVDFVLDGVTLATVRNICASQVAQDLMEWVYEPMPDIEGEGAPMHETNPPPLPNVPIVPGEGTPPEGPASP